MIETNIYQTKLTDELLGSLKDEVRTDLFDIINNVEFIQRLISPNRKYAKDLPRDSSGRILVDLCEPHLLSDMNYFRQAAMHFQKHGCYTKLMPNPNPQSEYGQWLKREVLRCWNGMIRESDGEWITGDMYFYLNYFPIIQTKIKKGTKVGERIIDFPEVWEGVYWRFHYWHQARYGGMYDNFQGAKHCIEIASRGKSHPYSQDVLTPTGFKKWKDISIGSELYGDDGNITKVVNIPFDDEVDVYKITLKDGREVYSSENHLWNVHKHGLKDDRIETKSLNDIISDYKRPRKITDRNPTGFEYVYSIPSNKAIDFGSKDVLIDPYTMGLLLGDGTFRHPEYINTVAFTAHKDDMEIYRDYIPYKINTGRTKFGHSINIDGVSDYLKSVGLFMQKSEGKFIPDEYKYNSKEVRLNLLKGLMDTDGGLSNGRPTYSSVSERLIKDVAFIARSLGYNCNYTKQKAGYKKDGIYRPCLDCYCLWIYTSDEIFRLPRKLNAIAEYTKGYSKSKRDKTRIVNIEFSHIEKSKCVTVDNESHSYLIGDFVQTHNSKSYAFGSKLTKNFILGENELARDKVKSLVAAYQKEYLIKDGTLNKFIDGITHCAKHTQFPSRKLKQSMSDLNWRAGFLDQDTGLEMGTLNEVLGVAIKDDSDKLRGKRSSAMLFEEFGSFPKFLDVWQTSMPNVQEGNIAFGQAISCGTGGSEGSDFSGALEMLNYPDGYNVYSLPNFWDKGSNGKKRTIFFFPGYVNSKGYYNEDGVSDVVGALISEIEYRINLKYNSSDPLQLTRRKAETAFTIQDAIMKRDGSLYPTDKLNDVINEINLNPKYTDDMWIGRLSLSKSGEVEYKPDNDLKYITEFPHKDNKAHPYYQKVKTPDGEKRWGDIKVGDLLYNTTGGTTRVIDIPFDDYSEIYEIKLKDGRVVRASEGHLWNIETTNKIQKTLTTKEMFKSWYRVGKEYRDDGYRNLKYFIPRNLGVEYNESSVRLNPYLMGLMLGDGCFTKSHTCVNKAYFASLIKDMDIYRDYIEFDYVTTDYRHHTINIPGFRYILEYYDLHDKKSHNKFIPDEYKYNSRDIRLDVIRGLMDTDGTIGYGGNPEFSTISISLRDDIIEIARSLGINCNIKTSVKNDRSVSWTVIFYTDIPLFKLPRKYNKQKITKNRAYKTGIYDIKYIGKEMSKCVTVDSTDHCYLIGDFITTHNCEGAICIKHMPVKNSSGTVPWGRYIAGADVYDDDSSDTLSLFSLFIHDLWTDELVFEYTGRPMFADDAYENARLALLMYNAECNYENNKKGFFAYMSKHNCLYLLSDTLEFLKDKEMVKGGQYGNKAHPYSETVNTKYGIKKWGDIVVGDLLIGTDGNFTQVIDIPFDNISDVYRITLKDGRSVMASENHLWDVVDWNDLKKTISTKEMLNGYFRNKGKYRESKYYIPKNNGINYPYKLLPMNPYLLGLVLGDGCFSISKWNNIHYTSNIDDMNFYMKYLNLDYITVDDRHHWIRYKDCSKIFKELNLHDKTGEDKFIPDIYKYSDRTSRLEIIRGLMDSDGTVGYGGNPEFTNTSLHLVDGIIYIARSLGINCNKTVAKQPGEHNKKAWTARFYTDERMFNLERKYSKQKVTKTRAFKTAIVNIEYVGRERSKCVTVDADDSCYLINDFVTTHNSKGTGNYGTIAPYGRRCYRDYILRSTPQINIKEVDGQAVEEINNVFNYQKIWSKGLLQETAMWTPDGNYDRHDAIIMLMLLREDKLRLLGDTSARDAGQNRDVGYLGKDSFFEKNYRKNDLNLTRSKLKFQ